MGQDIRILVVTQHWDPRTYGGVTTSVRRIAAGLVNCGASVTVFSFGLGSPSATPVTCQEGAVEVVRFGQLSGHGGGDPKAECAENRRQVFEAMETEARRRSFAGILSFFVSRPGWLAAYLAQSLRIPHVVAIRGSDVCLHIFEPRRLAPIGIAVENASAIVCVSDFVRQRLLMAFPKVAGKTRVILNGTNVGEAAQSRERARALILDRTGWIESSTIAVFLGVPSRKKGIKNLLEAVLAIPRDRALQLLCIGPEPEPEEMRICEQPWRRLMAEGRLHCTGMRPRSEALDLTAAGDVICLPSAQDGLANALLEGMALGLCPVVSDLFSGVITNRQTGLIVPRNDLAALIEALDVMTTNTGLRKGISIAAQQLVVAQFSPQREAEDYMQCFYGVGVGIPP